MPTKKKKQNKKNKKEGKQEEVKKEQTGLEKLGDVENLKTGTVNLVDGMILLFTGFFRLLGFSLSVLVDGIKWIFDKTSEPKKVTKKVKR